MFELSKGGRARERGKGVAKKRNPLPRVSNCLMTDFTWGLEKEQGRSKGMAKKRALADRFHLGLAVGKIHQLVALGK